MNDKKINREIISQMERYAQQAFKFVVAVQPKFMKFESADLREFDVSELAIYSPMYNWDNEISETVCTVSVGNFKCQYTYDDAFRMLAKMYSAFRIKKCIKFGQKILTDTKAKESVMNVLKTEIDRGLGFYYPSCLIYARIIDLFPQEKKEDARRAFGQHHPRA